MRHETQVELLRRFFAMRDARTTALAPAPQRRHVAEYTDPARAQLELAEIFRGRAMLVGLSGDLPQTGSYYETDCAGVPLLLVRGEDGLARGFLNICRHRGGRVASGSGQAGRAFKCPYHSWAYDLNGELLGQPLAKDGFEGLDRDQFGLIPVPVAERYGLVFAAPGGDEIDVESELCGMGQELSEYRLADFEVFARRSGVFDANWKLLFDTFLESYHIFSLHRESLASQLLSRPLVNDFFGPHSRGVITSRNVDELRELDETQWDLRRNAAIVYTLWPNALLNFPSSGHVDRWEVYPNGDSPHRARASFTMYVPRERAGERRLWDLNIDLTERVVFGEDFAQQEDIHRSLRCGLMEEVVFGRNEPNLIHHHDAIDDALRSTVVSPPGRVEATTGIEPV